MNLRAALLFIAACAPPAGAAAEVTLPLPSPIASVEPLTLHERGPRPIVDGHVPRLHRGVVRGVQANEYESLETNLVRAALTTANAAPMRVDMTDENKELEALFETFGRAG